MAWLICHVEALVTIGRRQVSGWEKGSVLQSFLRATAGLHLDVKRRESPLHFPPDLAQWPLVIRMTAVLKNVGSLQAPLLLATDTRDVYLQFGGLRPPPQ